MKRIIRSMAIRGPVKVMPVVRAMRYLQVDIMMFDGTTIDFGPAINILGRFGDDGWDKDWVLARVNGREMIKKELREFLYKKFGVRSVRLEVRWRAGRPVALLAHRGINMSLECNIIDE